MRSTEAGSPSVTRSSGGDPPVGSERAAPPLAEAATDAELPARGHLASLVRAYPIPFLAMGGLAVGGTLRYLSPLPTYGPWVWLATLVVGGIPLVYHTAQRLRKGQFASDVIASLAILVAILLNEGFAGVIIVLMQSGGEAIDSYAFHRASSSLKALLARAPRQAHRHRDGEVEEIPVEAVRVGDRLLVRTGDILPVDGSVAVGEALIDESSLTGEPLPRRHGAGDELLSGTVNVGPPFDLRAARVAGESQYARIVELVRSAQERKPRIQRLADRYAVWFTPLTLVVAVFGGWWTASAQTVLSVLVVATPCPLIIATPIAVIGAVNRAAERGIVVKSGGAIEEVGRAKAVLFDKTGTITSGQPEVERVVPLAPGVTEDELLGAAAALEAFSSHPLAAAVVRGARSAGVVPPPGQDVEEIPGAGVEGLVAGHRVLVGSPSFLGRRLGLSLEDAWVAVRARGETRGRMVSFVSMDGRAVGAILFSDRIRPHVPEMVRDLRRLGVQEVVMVTGDSRGNAEEVARMAEIPAYRAELLPQEKVDQVRSYRNRLGTTIMVGDGVNDAAALAAASVGVAMGARGAGISAEAADIVFLVDDVTRTRDAVSLGRGMVRIAQQGIAFGLGASLVLMAIAATGHILPAFGAVLQELIDIAVIVNALRVR